MTSSGLQDQYSRSQKLVRSIGIVAIVAGILLVAVGGAAWAAIRVELANQHVTVSDDAPALAGAIVDNPLSALAQAEAIDLHVTELAGGNTYAQLDQDDPIRDTLLDAAAIRTSLFTSVIAFGVSTLAIGAGLVFVLLGYAVRLTARPRHPENE